MDTRVGWWWVVVFTATTGAEAGLGWLGIRSVTATAATTTTSATTATSTVAAVAAAAGGGGGLGLPLFLLFYGVLVVVIVVAVLCGDTQQLRGTWVGHLGECLMGGWYEYLTSMTRRLPVLGRTCEGAMVRIEHECCGRPNPFMQLLYLALVAFGYHVASVHVVPGIVAEAQGAGGAIHRTLLPVMVALGLVLHAVTSFSDPGVVTRENYKAAVRKYRFDHLLYERKECRTCGIKCRPARSKHCSVCDRCVAKFDHHCPWINNCVGEKNVKWFLTFLLVHLLMCLYVCVLTIAFMRMEFLRAKERHGDLPVGEGVVALANTLLILVHFCFGLYPIQSVTTIMTGVLSLMLGGFFSYHMRLAAINITTNEMYKYDNIEYVERLDAKEERTWKTWWLEMLDYVTCRGRIRRHHYDEGCILNLKGIFQTTTLKSTKI